MQLLLEQITVPPGQVLLLTDISWLQYEAMLQDWGEQRAWRLAYQAGGLELMTPLPEHEFSNRAIDRFLSILTEELDLPCQAYGSTTLNRKDLARGAEPDSCYFFRGKPVLQKGRLDIVSGDAPDLVLEVDITHRDINKLELYAQLGVPEFWRFDGQRLEVFRLQDGKYESVSSSGLLPDWVAITWCNEFVQACRQVGMTTATRQFRKKLQAVIQEQA